MKNCNFIVHYNRSEPFRSITAVPKENLSGVLQKLDENNSWGLNRFSDPVYLQKRHEVEQAMRAEFMKKGGKPELSHPSYFFLGRSPQFEAHKKNIAYKINLGDVTGDVLSFTYGDSMFSMCENYRRQLGDEYQSHLCAQVYRLHELDSLISEVEKLPKKLHIECQLWAIPDPDIVKKMEVN